MLSVTFVLILLPFLIFSKATLYETNFCTCTLLSLDNVQSVVYCAFPPTHAQTTKNLTSQTVKFHWERVLSTPATRLLDFRQRIMESCWNAISVSQTSEGLLPLPNMVNKGISPD